MTELPEPMDGVNPPTDDGDEPVGGSDGDQPLEWDRGRKMASFMGRVTLYDPIAGDVSRANRPIEPPEPTVIEAHRIITEAFAAAGYHATVDFTRTDNER